MRCKAIDINQISANCNCLFLTAFYLDKGNFDSKNLALQFYNCANFNGVTRGLSQGKQASMEFSFSVNLGCRKKSLHQITLCFPLNLDENLLTVLSFTFFLEICRNMRPTFQKGVQIWMVDTWAGLQMPSCFTVSYISANTILCSFWPYEGTAICAFDLDTIDSFIEGTVFPDNLTQYYDPNSETFSGPYPNDDNVKFLPGRVGEIYFVL